MAGVRNTYMERLSMEDACETFIKSLIINGVETNPDLFIILSDVARKQGLALCTHQRGIQGTHIVFEKV